MADPTHPKATENIENSYQKVYFSDFRVQISMQFMDNDLLKIHLKDNSWLKVIKIFVNQNYYGNLTENTSKDMIFSEFCYHYQGLSNRSKFGNSLPELTELNDCLNGLAEPTRQCIPNKFISL